MMRYLLQRVTIYLVDLLVVSSLLFLKDLWLPGEASAYGVLIDWYVCYMLYSVLMFSVAKKTIGCFVLNMRLVSMDHETTKLQFSQVIFRSLAAPMLLLFPILLVLQFFREDKRVTFADRVSLSTIKSSKVV